MRMIDFYIPVTIGNNRPQGIEDAGVFDSYLLTDPLSRLIEYI